MDAAPLFADLKRAEQELVEWVVAERKKVKRGAKAITVVWGMLTRRLDHVEAIPASRFCKELANDSQIGPQYKQHIL